MNINPEYGVSQEAIVFKLILEELISKTPKSKKEKLYKQHCNNIERKNKERAKMLNLGSRKREYAEKPLKKDDFIRFYIMIKLLKTNYAAFIDDCTLNEAGYIMGVTRERVRQVEQQAVLKIKNPKMLKKLNKNNNLEAIMEYKELAIQRKNIKRRKQQ